MENKLIESYYNQLRESCKKYFDFDDENFERLKNITFLKKIKKEKFYLIIIPKQNISILSVKEFYELII